MILEIQVSAGDWGVALAPDIEAVFRSSASTLSSATDDSEIIRIALEPTPVPDGIPMTLNRRNTLGQLVVQLGVRGNLWAKLAFQAGHEFCHVLADPETWVVDQFFWIEEALCETASLLALRQMSRTWAVSPPYPNWRDYAVSLESYATERMIDPDHTLPIGQPRHQWLASQRPLLEADPYRRKDLVIMAKELIPVIVSNPEGWKMVRFLHRFPRGGLSSYDDFFANWRAACPANVQNIVESIARVFAT